jgi:ABC-type multidrug transport system fused ATPase/permease subunit
LRSITSTLEAPEDLAPFVRVSDRGMRIEFDDVQFRYPGRKADSQAIKGLSFVIEPSEVVARRRPR